MKKQLLIGLSIGICIGATAQERIAVKQNTTFSNVSKIEKAGTGFPGASTTKRYTAARGSRALASRTYFSSSRNAFGMLVSEQNCLTANQATNTILFAHRISQDWNITGDNNGYIQNTFTTNGAVTWDSLLQVQDNVNFCRYPSAAIFNPSGNTDPMSAFGVVSGPITNSSTGTSGNWTGNYFASTQLNKTNNDANIRINGADFVANQSFARINMSQAGDSMVFVTGGLYSGDPAGTTAVAQGYHGISLNRGKFNGTAFTWTVDSILPAYLPDPGDGTAQAFTEAVSAWSQDGSVGYVVAIGIDNAATGDKQAFQPMVWKSMDHGDTWNQMDAGDFSGIPSINSKLRPSTGGTKKAFYSMNSGMGAVVDANNNLHIVNVIVSGFSDSPDSLGFTYKIVADADNKFISYIYDTYTTSATGNWNAILVDSLESITADGNSPFDDGSGARIQIDARIQASRSTDGTHIFYIWTDTPDAFSISGTGENVLPNLKARGIDIIGHTMTPSTTFADDGLNFFMYASPITLVNGSTYSIPVTNSDSRDGSGSGLNPFNHYYRSGVQFTEGDFVGINEITTRGTLAISQNYPNPFSNATSIDVTLKDVSTVTLEVYDALGQKMFAQVAEKLATGTHTFTIDGAKFKPGIYFYTVTAGANTMTRKMVVQ